MSFAKYRPFRLDPNMLSEKIIKWLQFKFQSETDIFIPGFHFQFIIKRVLQCDFNITGCLIIH